MMSINVLEKYILENSQQIDLNSVTPYSEEYYYLELMQEMKTQKDLAKLDGKLQSFLDNNRFGHKNKQFLQMRYLLTRLDRAQSESERQKLMNQFNENFTKFQFQHQRTTRGSDNRSNLGNEQKLPSKLSEEQEKKFSFEYYLEKLYQNPTTQQLNDMNPQFTCMIDLSKLKSDNMNFTNRLIQVIDCWSSVKGLEDFLNYHLQKNNLASNYLEKIFNDLDVDQVQKYFKKFPALRNDTELFYNALYKRKFQEIDYNETLEEIKEKSNQRIKFLEQFEYYQSSISVLKKNLLLVQSKQDIYDEDLLADYLENPESTDFLKRDYVQNNLQAKQKNQFRALYIKNLGSLDVFNFIQKAQLNKDKVDLSRYQKYIEKTHLQSIETQAKLFLGIEVKNVEQIIDEKQLQQLHESRELSFWNNKTNFGENEEVNLKIMVKNIRNLRVRIFEVNTENFYQHQGQNANPNDIKIDCVIPNQEMEYSFDQPPMIKHLQNLNLDFLSQKKRGLFIVDLVGEEKNAKAIIRKGYLTLLYDRLTGRNCVIVDEQNQICKSDNTGLYIRNKFIRANPETGLINLHKDMGEQNTDVILVHNNFACPGKIKIQQINYSVNFIPVFNAEEFQPGKQVKIICLLDLYANDQRCPLNLLSESSVTIVSRNDDGIEQKKVYKNSQHQDNQDLVLDYMIPPKLSNMRIEFRSTVKKNKKDEKLYAESEFSFMRAQQASTNDALLRKNKNGEYILELFSFNGEPLQHKKANFTFNLSKSKRDQTFQLQSDEKGQFYLGKLNGVKNFQCSLIHKRFNIDRDFLYLPNQVSISENEEIQIPLDPNQSIHSFQILSTEENKKVQQPEIKDGYLNVKGLSKGKYQVVLLPNLNKINIDVVDGEVFELNGKNVIQKNMILGLEKNNLGLNAKVENSNQENIEVKLMGDLQNAKVHLLLTNQNFNSQDCNLNSTSLKQRIRRRCNVQYNIKAPKNTYYSNGRLGDELVYVYNRKLKQDMMGNTLEKPGAILKREKVQSTVENEEKIRLQEAALEKQCEYMDRCANDQAYMRQHREEYRHHLYDMITLRDFQNNHNSMIVPNLQINNDTLKIDQNVLKDYSNAYLFGHNGEGQFLLEIQNDQKPVKKNDLRLQQSKQQNKIYRYDRSMDYLKVGKEYQIPRIDKQEVSFVEDVKSLYEAICLMNPSLDEKDLGKLLSQWNTLQDEEKLKKYDKNACHELNLFLYMKDNEFFEGVVKPFIQNKKEKTITDYFMLQDVYNLRAYAKIEQLEKLNNIEKILLIKGLLEEDQQFVHSILNYYSMNASLDQIDIQVQKRLFDSILSTKKSDVSTTENVPTPNVAMMNNITQLHQAPMHRNMMLGAQNFSARAMPQEIRRSEVRRMKSKGRGPGGMFQRKVDLDRMNYQEELCDFNEVNQQEIFKPTQGTVEYQEKQYQFQYNNTIVKKFWFDLANYLIQNKTFEGFFSENFIHVCNQGELTECLAVLSFVDLKFDKIQFKSTLENNTLSFKPETPLIALTKEIIEEEGKQGDLQIMVGQRFFDPEDKYSYDETDPSLKYEKAVKEFVKGKVYESTVVVTNSTSTPLKVNLVYQIPQGSLRVESLNQMEIKYLILEPLQSQSQSFKFYFPEEGTFTIYPACVIKEDQILAVAQMNQNIEVKANKTIVELNTMQDILASGNLNDIVQFIEHKNILNPNIFSFRDIYWLLNNKQIYESLVKILTKRGVYDETVWSYSIKHNDLERFKQLLNSQRIRHILNNTIQYLDTDLVKIDNFKLLEYYPLVNPRTFSLQENTTNILNQSFKQTYQKFLVYLFQKDQLSSNDKVVLSNYLICQDRIDEANQLIQTVDSSTLEENDMVLQYDYLIAYLDFMNGYPKFEKAKKICEKYLVYPVLTWRNLFVEIANQLAEFEETELIEKMIDEDEEKTNQQKSKTAPSLDCRIEKNTIEITYENLESVDVKMFKIDLEAFVSLNPFSEISVQQYTYTTPFSHETINLDTNEKKVAYMIPEALKRENLFIQVTSQKLGISNSHYLEYVPFSLSYHINKEFGILKLIEPSTIKPVPKVYVKCFAEYKNGSKLFYKDGFTDLRGSFDYVSLNKDKVDDIRQFVIFVNSATHGCKIIKTDPPVKIGRVEGEAKNLLSKNWAQKQRMAPSKSKNRYANVLF